MIAKTLKMGKFVMSHILCVPCRFRNLIQKLESPKFAVFVCNRVMQRMGSDVAKESIKADFLTSSLGSRDLKNSSSDAEACVSGDDLGTGNPFCELTTFTGCELRPGR